MRREAVELLTPWMKERGELPSEAWLQGWCAETLVSASAQPATWFTVEQPGRANPGGGRLVPARFRHWAELFAAEELEGADIMAEALDIAVNDVGVPLAWEPPRAVHRNSPSAT